LDRAECCGWGGFEFGGSFVISLLTLLTLLTLLRSPLPAATLSDPAVDRYNTRIGTQTFSGLYQFTSNNLLIETAQAIYDMGSDNIKMYMGANFPGKYNTNLAPSVTNLMTLARNEPNCRTVLDMPFRRIIAWTYPLSNPDAPFQNGNYTATEAANDYREMYDLTRYLLTNYNNSGKTFYLGHWEGDGYLSVNNWSTNPPPAEIPAMVAWLNNRQKAIDDAKAATTFSNVNVFGYSEVNRVRDAMNNGTNNNVRSINYVIPYVTNLDYVSYSSYDAQNLSTANLYATLDYIEAHIPTNKAAVIPGERLWIGEYGWGKSQTSDQQEPTTRAYIQRLLNYPNHALPFILFWEMYDNELLSDGSDAFFCLIDTNNVKVPCWYLHNRFINQTRLLTAQFQETNGRLPTDSEWLAFASPLLDQPLPAPVALGLSNRSAVLISNTIATVSGSLAQGIYGDDGAGVWLFWGRQDGGTNLAGWERSQFVGVNTNFNPTTFTATLNNLSAGTNYFFRFYAANNGGSAWAPVSSSFSTVAIQSLDFGSGMKICFTGYNRNETLSNFPALIVLSTNLPGFSYRQFASSTGGDLRFTDAGGLLPLPHEIDEWNTNGTSYVWVQVPALSGTNDFIWAYWGNPLNATPPASMTNGAVWAPNNNLVWHLKESAFPFADSAQQHPATSGTLPTSSAGVIGRGVSLNGTSQFLNAGPIALGNAFTLSSWIKIDAAASDIQPIWANKGGGWNGNGFALFVDSYQTTDRMLRLETGDGVGGTAAVSAAGAVSFAQWHLVTAAIDRSAGTARLFIDGADVTQSGPAFANFGNTGAVQLGQTTNAGFHFKGLMDEVRIENVARSSNWVWAAWLNTASNSTFATTSPVTRQQPALSLTAGPGALSLTWPASGVGFLVSTATNLTPPVSWTPVTNQPVWDNVNWRCTLPQTDSTRFYRLQAL
jgi:hypothetical protein